MTFSILATDQLISMPVFNHEQIVLTNDARILVGLGNGIQSTGGFAGTVENISLMLHGEIAAAENGIDFYHGFANETHNTDIKLFDSATISSGSDGIAMREGVDNTIVNFGEIASVDNGILSRGGELSVSNYGTISASGGVGSAINIENNAHGSDFREISNAGIVHYRADTPGTAILNDGGSEFVISNTGVIDAGAANDALNSSASLNSLFNSGTITGDVVFSNQASVFNTGTIDGSVELSADADVFNGRKGEVTGSIFGGDGDDTYIVNNTEDSLIEHVGEGIDLVKSTVSFSLDENFESLTLLTTKNINGVGNNADNIINGNNGDNRLQGQAGNDYIHGRLGDDKLLGSFDNDLLVGGKGDDLLKGGIGDDMLNGSNGYDKLIGASGHDVLSGERGDDLLIGGAGQDTLTGGIDDDVFLFNRIAHSHLGASDSITDFSTGEDVIDLSAFNGTFDFIGTGTFSGAKEVRYFDNGVDWTVLIDVNGDAAADMRILVNSATALTEVDFVL